MSLFSFSAKAAPTKIIERETDGSYDFPFFPINNSHIITISIIIPKKIIVSSRLNKLQCALEVCLEQANGQTFVAKRFFLTSQKLRKMLMRIQRP